MDSIHWRYYDARYYDPELARFVQPDTIVPNLWDPQSFNRYSYVLNNPLRYTDPTGNMQSECGKDNSECGGDSTYSPDPNLPDPSNPSDENSNGNSTEPDLCNHEGCNAQDPTNESGSDPSEKKEHSDHSRSTSKEGGNHTKKNASPEEPKKSSTLRNFYVEGYGITICMTGSICASKGRDYVTEQIPGGGTAIFDYETVGDPRDQFCWPFCFSTGKHIGFGTVEGADATETIVDVYSGWFRTEGNEAVEIMHNEQQTVKVILYNMGLDVIPNVHSIATYSTFVRWDQPPIRIAMGSQQ